MLLDSIIFVAGAIVGALAVWGYAEWQWKRNPYKFKTIVDGVIAYRETKEKQMDKNVLRSSRGRAHSIASIVLRRFAEGGGLLDEVATDVTPEELAKVRQALIDLADEHGLHADEYRRRGVTDAPEWENDGE